MGKSLAIFIPKTDQGYIRVGYDFESSVMVKDIQTLAEPERRPWGVPKKRPFCKDCGIDLIGEASPDLNVTIETHSSDGECGQTFLYCSNCGLEVPFFRVNSILTYWDNGGIRQKPGRKPKSTMSNDESAA